MDDTAYEALKERWNKSMPAKDKPESQLTPAQVHGWKVRLMTISIEMAEAGYIVDALDDEILNLIELSGELGEVEV